MNIKIKCKTKLIFFNVYILNLALFHMLRLIQEILIYFPFYYLFIAIIPLYLIYFKNLILNIFFFFFTVDKLKKSFNNLQTLNH